MKVIVYHGEYGCETGCMGHWIEIGDGPQKRSAFDFMGKMRGETDREYAERIVREEFGEEHVADLDWDNCRIVEDC